MNGYVADSDPHWVYIFRDVAGDALYVGCTGDLGRRMAAHSRDKGWYGQIASVESFVYPDRERGLARESDLIRELRPRHERSSAMRSERGERRREPCRRCRRARHSDCLTTNGVGEPCPCSVCERDAPRLRMGVEAVESA